MASVYIPQNGEPFQLIAGQKDRLPLMKRQHDHMWLGQDAQTGAHYTFYCDILDDTGKPANNVFVERTFHMALPGDVYIDIGLYHDVTGDRSDIPFDKDWVGNVRALLVVT